MANDNKNQEFNRAIKQLQSMVKDKLFIGLAEGFHNLKNEMANLTRAVKEKESSLLLEETKVIAPKPVEKEVVAPVEMPKEEVAVVEKVEARPQENRRELIDRSAPKFNNQTFQRSRTYKLHHSNTTNDSCWQRQNCFCNSRS